MTMEPSPPASAHNEPSLQKSTSALERPPSVRYSTSSLDTVESYVTAPQFFSNCSTASFTTEDNHSNSSSTSSVSFSTAPEFGINFSIATSVFDDAHSDCHSGSLAQAASFRATAGPSIAPDSIVSEADDEDWP
ncbi:hypothetical protein HDU88_005609, partial [Geranomyces variabilis]